MHHLDHFWPLLESTPFRHIYSYLTTFTLFLILDNFLHLYKDLWYISILPLNIAISYNGMSMSSFTTINLCCNINPRTTDPHTHISFTIISPTDQFAIFLYTQVQVVMEWIVTSQVQSKAYTQWHIPRKVLVSKTHNETIIMALIHPLVSR